MNKPTIYAVDFDGTLCENAWPEIGRPNESLIRMLIRTRASGDKVILWTCRSDDQLDRAVAWCKERGLEFDAVNDNLPEIIEAFGGNSRKIFANCYIDDLSVTPQSLIPRTSKSEILRRNAAINAARRKRLERTTK